MSNVNELDKRVTVLEVELKNMTDSLTKLDKRIEENIEVTFQIKEHIDRQNGKLPYIVDMVNNISERQEQIADKLNSSIITSTGNHTKVKIMWGNFAIVSTGLLGFILKSILGY